MKKEVESQKILIGKILKETRRSLGLTQEEVSEQLGLARRYISDIERDKTKGSLDTLETMQHLSYYSYLCIKRLFKFFRYKI